MKSTEAISASDYPFFWKGWQHFDEKRQPNFRERLFQPLIGDLVPIYCQEMSTFSNDAGRDIFKDGLEAVREREAGKRQGVTLPVMIQSSVESDNRFSCTGNRGGPWKG